MGGDTEQKLRKVAQAFESLFMNEMLKAMRSANAAFGEGNFMNSNESKTYQDMHDQQLAVTLSKEGRGIGLADVLVRQMSKIKQPSSRPNPFAQVEQPVAAQSEAKAEKVATSEEMCIRDRFHASLDQNTVDLQIEQSNYAENSVQFQASFTFLNSKFKGLTNALRGE